MAYSEGGVLKPGWTTTVIRDEECILDRDMRCVRTDNRHHYEQVEISTFGEADPRYVRGRCFHRHTEYVELSLTDERVARICLHCSAQLPA